MPDLNFFNNRNEQKDELPKEADRLLKVITNNACLSEDLRENRPMNGLDKEENRTSWQKQDAQNQNDIDTLNVVIAEQGIQPEKLIAWMKKENNKNINYSQRFWMIIVDGKPVLELNHFYKFKYGMERAKIAKELRDPSDRNEYLQILNRKIAEMNPKAAPGEIERWAKANGLDVKDGQLVFQVKKK